MGAATVLSMGLVFAGISAFEYWRRYDGPIDLCRNAPAGFLTAKGREEYRPHSIELAELPQRGFASLSDPLHLMVPDPAMRLKSQPVVWRVCSSRIPREELYEVVHGVYVASPRLSLIQLADGASPSQVAKAAFELSGSYRIRPEGRFVESWPLVSPESLRTLPKPLNAVRGSVSLRRVARYVLPGSASPTESALVILLCFPSEFGGYGFPRPKLNGRVDAGHVGRGLTGKSYFKPDLYWPEAKLAVEYDSKQFHSSPEKLAADAARRNVLLHKGIEVVTVSADQLMNAIRFDEVVGIIGRKLGKRMRYRGKDVMDKRYQLRRDLFASDALFPSGQAKT